MPGTRKLGRTTANRMAMLRGMVTLLLETGKVDTTVTRAKEVRCLAEKMITLGKKNTLASRRQALAFITKEDVVKKLFDQIAPANEGRNGGYTAIYKLGPRRGDGAEMARIVLVAEMEKAAAEKKAAAKKKPAKSKKAAAKEAAVEAPAETVEAPVEEAPAEEAVEAPAEEAVEAPAEEAVVEEAPAAEASAE
ncbi:MAG: 50S ribosomal protein L17 [Clostridia bacterium]|nr:50S ribosomal protein L17 [Clostridia bacterium]